MRIKWLSTIRVVGLSLVLLYHFFISTFPGGFIGVDLFFTLSGYLTTALLIDEFTKHHSIDILAFFKRRLYRILPPLVFTILLVLPLTLLIRSDFRANIGQQVAAALGFMTNFFEILAGGSYENQFSPHLFVHTWTLAIEVQYYILWPILIWGMSRVSKTVGKLRGSIFLTSTILFAISFISMFSLSFFVDNFSSIYYSSLTHSFPFFLGGILATFSGVSHTTAFFEKLCNQWTKGKAFMIFITGMLIEILLLFTLQFNSIWTYLVGFLLSSLATSAMIVAARILHEKTVPNEPKPILYLANISYGIYLFHWPLVILLKQWLGNTIAAGLALTFSIILSSISFYILEPYVAGKVGNAFGLAIDLSLYRKQLLGAMALFTIMGIGVVATAPKLGAFEQESMISNLYQAQTQLNTTRAGVENAKVTGFEIQAGVTIFGDSVTVRAGSAIQTALPDAQVDGTVSRNLSELSNLMTLYQKNNNLKETVVIALGTNTHDDYKELLDQFVTHFPKGRRLIFVTPYDGNFAPENSIAYQTGQYERELAKQYDYISIADWYQVALDNPVIWYHTDLVHFNLESNGAELFAQTIKTAVEQATDGPLKQ